MTFYPGKSQQALDRLNQANDPANVTNPVAVRAIQDCAIIPAPGQVSGSPMVEVKPGIVLYPDGTYDMLSGSAPTSPATGIIVDLTSYIPTSPTVSQWAGIYASAHPAVLGVVMGAANTSANPPGLDKLPAIPDNSVMVGAVRMYPGMPLVQEGQSDTDIFDARTLIPAASGVVNMWPWNQDGDIIYRKATATQGANIALSILGVVCTGHDLAGDQDCLNLIDGNDTTFNYENFTAAGGWIRLDFLSTKTLWGFRLRVLELSGRSFVFDLSYSPDNVTYTPFETGVTATGDGSNIADLTQAFTSPITARYIKLTYVSTGQPYSDTIFTFGVYQAAAVTYPAVLHPRNDGDVLTLVGGLPAWVTP